MVTQGRCTFENASARALLSEGGELRDSGTDHPSRDVLVPEVWADFYEEPHIPAAVRVGDTLRLTGHTGETPDGVFSPHVETQIRQVFRNIALTLAETGATWANVVEIHSYHVGLRNQAEAVLRIAAEFLEGPYPAWTAIGVTELITAEALIEIRCVAVVQAKIM